MGCVLPLSEITLLGIVVVCVKLVNRKALFTGYRLAHPGVLGNNSTRHRLCIPQLSGDGAEVNAEIFRHEDSNLSVLVVPDKFPGIVWRRGVDVDINSYNREDRSELSSATPLDD